MQKPSDSNTDVSFDVFVEVFFHLAWRQIFQCSMRPFGIIKLNIGSDAGLKCSIGSNISSVELFFSMTQKMTLLPHCHVAHRGTKKTAVL